MLKCVACPSGFSTNYFYSSNNVYNPYVCYKVISLSLDFYQSYANCIGQVSGASLMRIRDATEKSYANLFFASLSTFWLDSFINVAGTSYNWGDGSIVTYFCSSQPNNSGGN